jgi:hypothetical protein
MSLQHQSITFPNLQCVITQILIKLVINTTDSDEFTPVHYLFLKADECGLKLLMNSAKNNEIDFSIGFKETPLLHLSIALAAFPEIKDKSQECTKLLLNHPDFKSINSVNRLG